MRWFRSHASKLNNPKVQRLSDRLYRAWDSLLCIACEFDGVLPAVADTSFLLRKTERETQEVMNSLIERGFLVITDRGCEPHQWNEWQYKSDVSTERVKRFRKRHRNVSVTPSESEADTETDSVPNGTGGKPPDDPVKLLFNAGVELLTANGCKETNARSLIGKWRKDVGDEAVMGAITEARRLSVTEPIAWFTQRFAGKAAPRETWDQRRIREGREMLRQ